jgi:hypothetical protein
VRAVGPLALRAVSGALSILETRVRRSVPIERFCHGQGIEVGAAATPAIVPMGRRIRYVDKYDASQLASDPELDGLYIAPPDIISSAEKLERVATQSQDFVLAYSLLEHVQDPIGALESFVRVTKSGGTIIVSVPDKRYYPPDHERPLTTFEHLERDYRDGAEWSREGHFREYASYVAKLSPADTEAYVKQKMNEDGHTHFHVWTSDTFLDFVLRTRAMLKLPIEIVEFAQYHNETLCVLRVARA